MIDLMGSNSRMSVAAACQIVDEVANELVTGVPLELWPALFEKHGASGIDGAILALELASADLYLRTRDEDNRKGFDEFVSASQRMINTLDALRYIECDEGTKPTKLSWQQDYGEFTRWLRERDANSPDFWELVNYRVGKGFVGARLNPSLVLGLSMGRLASLVGKPVRMPFADEFEGTDFEVSTYNRSHVAHLTNRKAGLSLAVRDGLLDTVFLYFNGKDSYGTFSGGLEGGITALDSRRKVRGMLGPPSSTAGSHITYESEHIRRRYEFSAWLGRLQLIVLSPA